MLEARTNVMTAPKQYIQTNQYGVRKVGRSGVRLDSVVYAFEQGESAEAIVRQFPSLTLEEAYGTITYYLANREEVAAYLKQQAETATRWEAWSRTQSADLYEKLRKAKAEAEAAKKP